MKTDTISGTTGRVAYLDLLKVIAIFGVLIIHSTSAAFVMYDVYSLSYFFTVFISCVSRVCVPVFIMCSGTVFLSPTRDVTVREIYKKYILRIVCVLAIFAVFYSVMVILEEYTYVGVFDKIFIDNTIDNLLSFNTHFHLYYLYIIIVMYALVPPIKVFLKSASRKNEFYFLAFLFVTANFLPTLRMFWPFNEYFGGMTLQYSMNLVYGMLSYFFLGHYLSSYDITKIKTRIIYILGAAGAIITFILVSKHKLIYGVLNENYINAMTINVYFMSAAIFLLCKKYGECIKSTKVVRIIAIVSKSTFSIYLIHQFYNMVFARIGFTLEFATPFVSLPLMIIANFSLSFLSYLFFKKIPFLKKLV